MAEKSKTIATVQQTPSQKQESDAPKPADQVNKEAGGEKGKKAPPLGTDARPPAKVEHQDASEQKAHEKVEKGKLGDGGPSSDAKGVNQGNMREEEEQSPVQNATAGGPDVGRTPANAPGMSHS